MDKRPSTETEEEMEGEKLMKTGDGDNSLKETGAGIDEDVDGIHSKSQDDDSDPTSRDEPVQETDTEPQEKTAFLDGGELTVLDNDRETTLALKRLGILDRLNMDMSYRRRCIHSIWLFFSFISLGWNIGVVGPTYPDMRLIVNKDLATGSWLFTIGAIGYLLGSLIGGILYDHFDKLLLIFFSTLGLAITCGVVPWCEPFPLMLMVRFAGGLSAGGLDTGGNADMVSIWDEEGRPFMQALHFCFGFGGIIAPFVAEPFLAPRDCISSNSHDAQNISELNFTMTSANPMSVITMLETNSGNSTNKTSCTEVHGETKVQYAYLILSILTVASAVPFLVMYIKALRKNKPHMTQADQSGKERPDKLPFKLKVVLLIVLSAMMMMYCAVEDTFAGFLMTFSLEHLHWDKAKGSLATSLYWIAFSCGRFLGIFLIKIFMPIQLLLVFLILLIGSFTGLLISSITFTTPLIWLFIALTGFSMSIVFPCIFTWTEESILQVTGKISSMFLIAASSGLMINPIFLGNLMTHYTPMWFMYLLLSESVLVFSVFLILLFLVRNVVSKVGTKVVAHPLTLVENERLEASCWG